MILDTEAARAAVVFGSVNTTSLGGRWVSRKSSAVRTVRHIARTARTG